MSVVTDESREAESRPMNSTPRQANQSKLSLLAAGIALLGLLILLYPSIASWNSQLQQSQLISQYSDEIHTLGPSGQNEALQEARDYNSLISGGGQVAAGERVPIGTSSDATPYTYEDLLAGDRTGLMARLKIPAINLDLPIYHGTSDATLERGVGHLEGSSLPVGGVNTHSVLTAHRGLASAELFTHLDQVHIGDTFTIEVFGEVLSYRVTGTQVVEPDQTESLFPQAGKDLVTLVTCTPLGINSQRILVTGERILPTPAADIADAGHTPDIPGFPWWAVWLTTGIAVIVLYLWWSRRTPRQRGQVLAQ